MSFSCRICGSNNRASLFEVNKCHIIRCVDCGLMQMEQPLDDEMLSQIYGTRFFQETKYFMNEAARKEQERRLSLLCQANVPAGGRVLDVGCAAGDFLLMAKDDYEMWGTDYSEFAVGKAKTRIPEIQDRLFSGSADDLDLADGFFDAITLWDVIEHLDDPVRIVKALKPKLKPGGSIFVSTPNAGALIARMMGKRWAFMHPPEHVLFFEKQHISSMMNQCGLEMENWVTFGKSINIAFLVYKFGRVFPEITPQWLVKYLSTSRLGRPTVYIPTGDIQYARARLSASSEKA